MNVSGSLEVLFIFSAIRDDKTGLGRDVSPAYLFLLHWVGGSQGLGSEGGHHLLRACVYLMLFQVLNSKGGIRRE